MTVPATNDGLPEYGPAMLALGNDKQRAWVSAYFDAPKNDGRILFATRAAGYGTPESSTKSLSVIGSRLHTNAKIQAALAEESYRRLRGLAPSAVKALENLLDDPHHKEHGRAIGLILERTDAVTTTHNVVVERRDQQDITRATAQVLARIEELATRAGLKQLPPVIDAEFTAVNKGEADDAAA